jgi:alpha-tubulin suppressor-like RCC1 family protein
MCWGYNGDGELGDGTTTHRGTPTAIEDLIDVECISAGADHTCAALRDGSAWCWGSNAAGQVGRNAGSGSLQPVRVEELHDVVGVAAGGRHSCAVRATGTVACWGDNRKGQLGNGSTLSSLTPVLVHGIEDATSVAAASDHTCVLRRDGSTRCWGSNFAGALGNGSSVEQSELSVVVTGLGSVADISTSGGHTCGLLEDGTAVCWGSNYGGPLGDGSSPNGFANVPVPVADLVDVAAISAGFEFSCAVVEDGTANCWGSNSQGMLGDGTHENRGAPAPVEPW